MKKCTYCGKEYTDETTACVVDGQSLVQCAPPIASSPNQQSRIGSIARDVLIIVLLTFVGGLIIGLVTPHASPPSGKMVIAASNLLLGTVGFVISGSRASGPRWRHLAWVAVGVWLAGLMNVLLFDISIGHWILSVIVVAFMMGLGGVLSYIFRKDN